jgi:hypothetical protein
MTFVLERSNAVGGTWVAAVVNQTVHRHATGNHLVLTAERHPVAILLGRGEQLAAFTTAGEPLAMDEVERWCPGATAQFLRSQTSAEAWGNGGGNWGQTPSSS